MSEREKREQKTHSRSQRESTGEEVGIQIEKTGTLS